jgi:hypothetical protein
MTGLQDSLRDIGSWLALGPGGQLEVLRTLAAASGRELQASLTEPNPRRLLTGGPRLIHRRTGLRFCLVPGGRHLVGPRRERRAVELEPFLLAEAPLSAEDGARHFELRWNEQRTAHADDIAPLYVLPDELSRVLAGPLRLRLRLPNDDEWEAAYRAGTTSTWFWGETQPKAPPALPHPLGLSMMAFFDELTADPEAVDQPERHRVRGGAARIWPWQDGGQEWMWLMSSAKRMWIDEGEPRDVAVRFALSL